MLTVLLYFLLGLGIGALAALVVHIGKIVMSALAKRIKQMHGKFVLYMKVKKFEAIMKKEVGQAETSKLEDLFAADGIAEDDIMEIQHDGENFNLKKSDFCILDSDEGIEENFSRKLDTHNFLNVAVAG